MDIAKYYAAEAEKPLDVIKPDGGFFGIFRTVGCIGDSLSSGEMESLDEKGNKGYHDYYEYSWGQYMARATACTVYNFSRGGMTARDYINSFAEASGFWNPDKVCQAYIIALGVNDLCFQQQPLGSIEDIDLAHPDRNAPTFAGYYGKIIQKYKAISPKARFFLMTMVQSGPHPEKEKADHAALLYKIARLFELTYVLDFCKYAPHHDAEFRRHFYLGDHLNAAGYLLTAQQVMSYIDYLIRSNPEDFTQAAFIGRGGVHNSGAKW